MPDETTPTMTVPETATPTTAPEAPQPVPGGAATGEQPKPTTFSQDDLNRFLAAERRKWQESEELKGLRAKAKRADELEEAGKTEIQRLTERAEKAERLAEEQATRYRQAAIQAQFAHRAAAAGIPGERIDGAFRLADLSAVSLDDTGTVTGLDEAIKALPEWVKRPDRPAVPDINSGSTNGQTQPDPAAREAEIRQRFRL